MARQSIRHLALVVGSTLALSGCVAGTNPFAKNENPPQLPISTETAEAPKSLRQVDRDVEAPELFQTTDTALWDGRPSLGGVWVASPDAVNPERVILRNEANGKFVIGALFRRERDNPGPKLQISSDAAEALGLLAGQPGKVNVTALRHDDGPAKATAAAAKPDVAPDPVIAEGDVETTAAADPIAAAGAAIDRADGTDSVATEAVTPAPSDDLDPTPRPGETKRDARKRARAAAKAAKVAAAALVAAPAIDGETALAAPVPSLEVAPLPDVATTAIPAAVPAATPGSARVQIGIFSVEENAQRAADKLKAGGVAADIRKEETKGKAFWSVVATGDGTSKALLTKVKGLGFTDAYAVSG